MTTAFDALPIRVPTHYELSGAARRGEATGDNNVLRYSYVKTLYLTHYKGSGASGKEQCKANRS